MNHDERGGLLRTIVAVLGAARIPHTVVGSFTSTAHGEPRTMRDLDLSIDPSPNEPNELLGRRSKRFHVDPDVARLLWRRSMPGCLGEHHLRRAVSEHIEHYQGERNHQGAGNRLLTPHERAVRPADGNAPVERRERLVDCSTSITGALHESHDRLLAHDEVAPW